MTREEFIKNSTIIQKSLKNCTQEDLQYLQYIGNWWKLDSKDLRLKQLIYHMCSWLNIFELWRLKKSFTILMKL